ncbi:MAG: hypothetical protein LH475_04430 [Cryobacterium sp.]|uniref:FGGY-family carbohydrate kinase n=1 Tax=unclassified Cryobacterium TaxID=2649013 RepID=UPI0022A3F268|nr:MULTISPECIES: FGGY-family carbohydrate kinase [unclassified Cryobacterium]MCY7403865.1 hypothetical protein [Cryobacterium sp.]
MFADAAGGQLALIATINGARTLVATARMIDADGLLMLPYLDGERTPNLPGATGSLTGKRRANMNPENLAQASVLGVVCSLADALDSLRSQGVPVRQAAWALDGGSNFPHWKREIATELEPSAARDWAVDVRARYAEQRGTIYGV